MLVVDDEPAVRFTVQQALESAGHAVLTAADPDEASAAARGLRRGAHRPRDARRDGLSLLAEARAADPDLPVVLLTARGTERDAVAAMKLGAYDYLTKPFVLEELRAVMARAVEARDAAPQRPAARAERAMGRPLVGESAAFRRLVDDARRVARRQVTVLLRGETGTGKELVASLIHAESPRRDGPCVRFNCAAIPAELAEAELFGHAKGAFTGAVAARRGYFAQADGGTLVLDEVGELPLASSRSSCGRCRRGRSSRWGRPGSSGSTCGWWPRRTATCARPSPRGASARTSTTASPWWS
jgi:DNA-binding NtrC family response regulator